MTLIANQPIIYPAISLFNPSESYHFSIIHIHLCAS